MESPTLRRLPTIGDLLRLTRREIALVSAVVCGSFLRGHQLIGQILVDDEWHAIHKAIRSGYLGILTSFGGADHSIPIAIYYKIAIDSVGLSELVIRLPFFVGGVMTIVVVPVLCRHVVSREASNVLAWLLATSPSLVFFSRFARPYALVVFFGTMGVLAAFLWWSENKRRYGVLYIVSAVCSGYLHLTALPFVLSPFVFFLATTVLQPSSERAKSFARLFRTGLVVGFLLLALLFGPLFLDSEALESKLGRGNIELASLARATLSLFGAGKLWIIPSLLIVSVGIFRSFASRLQFGSYLITLTVFQLLAVFIASPIGVQQDAVLGRYLLLILPVLLLFASIGIWWCAESIDRLRTGYLSITVAAAICIALFFSGPLPKVYYQPNNWMANVLKKGLKAPDNPLRNLRSRVHRVSEFYRTLRSQPASGLTVVEAPWILPMGRNHLPLYQRIHRQVTRIGFTDGLCSDSAGDEIPLGTPGVKLRNFVFLANIDEMKRSDVDYVVFHTDLRSETKTRPPGRQSLDVSDCIAAYRESFGPPDFSDADLVVFAIPRDNQRTESK